MLTRDYILTTLKQNKPVLQSRYPIGSLALFGSYAREEQTPESDIDILVQLNSPIGFEFIDLLEELEVIFAGSRIDLISKAGIKPHYLPYIEDDAIYV